MQGPSSSLFLRASVDAVLAALALGVLSTLGDFIWAKYLTDGAILPGVIHGALIFLAIALVLAWSAERAAAGSGQRVARRLVASLPALGVGLAAVFYPLAYALGYLVSLLITWVGMWCGTAALYRWARDGREPRALTLARGAAAAVGSGLAFWAISGIWTRPSPDGPDYAWHLACWTFAFLPGFAALLLPFRAHDKSIGAPDAAE